MKGKKGNLDLIIPAVMTIALASMILIFGLILLDSLVLDTAETVVTVHNETFQNVQEACQYVSAHSACAFSEFSILMVSNETGDITSGDSIIQSGNYSSCGRGGIHYIDTAAAPINDSDWNVTYTYKYSNTEACRSGNTTLQATGTFADYFDLIALAVIIVIVISLLLIMFGTRKVR